MGIEGVSAALPGFVLLLLTLGLAFTASARMIVMRFGGGALLAYCFTASVGLALWIGQWVTSSLSNPSERAWNFYLIPFLFLMVQLGLVSLYIWRSSTRDRKLRHQLLLGFVIFILAMIPAAMAAALPDAIQFFN